jgi:RND family efflux transporter MFP subunit
MKEDDNVDRRPVDPTGPGSATSEANRPSRTRLVTAARRRRWPIVAVLVLGVTAVVFAFVFSRGAGSGAGRPVPAPVGIEASPAVKSSAAHSMPGDVSITLTPDKLANAEIMIEAAAPHSGTAVSGAAGIRTTGTVQANEYKQTPVVPVTGGIVREVNVELGDKVKRGQSLLTIFSTELADSQSEYLKMLAELEEHHKHHQRAIELVEIGAISREELDDATTKYKSAQAAVASVRQRLILLGVDTRQIDELKTSSQVSSLISVSAPASGTVINRDVNVGEVIDKGKELFSIADLSTVWVIGQIYENDFRSVGVGTPALITTPSYPGQSFNGRISYLDPRVDPNTRTSQVRIEIPNRGMVLRLGMFVDVSLGGAARPASSGQPTAMVPRPAVQHIGSKQVVYLAAEPGVFIQREVNAGLETNGVIPIYSGVSAGDRIVTEGSFLLRAESLKLNPTQATSPSSLPPQPLPSVQPQETAKREPVDSRIQTAKIVLNADGYSPGSIRLRKNVPARLSFVRTVEVTCGTEVVIPDFNIKRDLPLNQVVIVEFTPDRAGEFSFACGMNMVRGKIVVK